MKRVLFLFWVPVLLCFFAILPLKAEAKDDAMSLERIEAYLEADGLEYYAYMILEEAPEELEPIILEARNRIIHNSSWVADDLQGWVVDPEGTVVEIVPQFHEIFPADWEIPQCE